MPNEIWVALVAGVALVIGYLLKPVGDLLGVKYQRGHAEQNRRRDFQFETLQELSLELERWRYAGDTITSETAKYKVERLIFKVKDDRLRELVERMLVVGYEQEFQDTYGNVLRRLGEVQREL